MKAKSEVQTHKMDKAVFMSVFDDGVSVKRNNEVLMMIQERFQYIMETLFRIQGAKLEWYDFDNEGGEGNPGEFDQYRYRYDTHFTGEWSIPSKAITIPELDDYAFPNKWYYEDFEQSVVDKLKSLKEERERKEEERKKRQEESKKREAVLLDSIKKKLSPEEIAYLKKHKIKL